jgi:hypothetical protein
METVTYPSTQYAEAGGFINGVVKLPDGRIERRKGII